MGLIVGAAATWLWTGPDRTAGGAVRTAQAVATVAGGPPRPQMRGTVAFRTVPGGTEVTVDVEGLPPFQPGPPPIGPHGFHVHEFGTCEAGDPADPFLAAGNHFNPDGRPHGDHAGDFPVLFSEGPRGVARMTFFTARITPADVVGRTIIIHENPDDFRTQPAGAAGRRLACGVIRAR